MTGRFEKELYDVLPKSWKYLAVNGAGYDRIDPEACLKRDPPAVGLQCSFRG